jgi:hypothetical protein
MAAPAAGIPTYRYPFKALKEFDDYLEIQIVQYSPPKFSQSGGQAAFQTSSASIAGQNQTPRAVIILPIPQTIQDGNSVGWGENKLNAFEMLSTKALSEGFKSSNPVAGALNAGGQFLSGVTDFARTGNLQDQVTSFYAAQIVNSLGGNVDTASLVSRATGQVLNPNMELLFTGVNLREFSFDFDFAPRDGNEAQQVKAIINTLKRESSARSTSSGASAGLFISAPSVFKLQYKSGGKKHPFLNTFKPMALKGIQVNYTGSGTYAVYGDSTPVHMKMTINLSELNPIYFEDYDKQEAKIGVGY